jgi:sulfite reductase alpha subunit-like flavoprotein
MVCSTTGNGDPPDNASKFWRKLRIKKDKDWLDGVQFTVLGLGDTNYDQFCAMGKNLDKTLKKHGAKEFFPCGFADEAVGLDNVVEPWKKSLFKFVKNMFGKGKGEDSGKKDVSSLVRKVEPREVDGVPRYRKPAVSINVVEEFHKEDNSAEYLYSSRWKISNTEAVLRGYTPDTPFLSEIKSARYLTSPESIKQVIHLSFDLPFENRGITYCVGDSIGIYCPNDFEIVEKIIKRLNLDPNTMIAFQGDSGKLLPHIHTPCSVQDALLYCCDLAALPQKAFLRILAEYCLEEKDRESLYFLCGKSKESRQAYDNEILKKRPTLLEILQRFPSCYPDLAHLMEQLPALSPRYYSVSSSPTAYPTELHVALTVVRYRIDEETNERKGLCSSWLYEVCALQKFIEPRASLGKIRQNIRGILRKSSGKIAIPVFIRKGKEFTLPSDTTKPIIMIGPGTGVSPFRGFSQQRQLQTKALRTGGRCVGWWRGFELDLEEKETEDPFEDEEIPQWGRAILYFGCRRRDWDYLYGEEFESLELDRALDAFRVAFSREDDEPKTYVQDLLKKHANEVYEMTYVNKGYIFVCGDVSVMARDVQNTFAQIISQKSGIALEQASSIILEMIKEGRYVQDIWN